jgi:hypothetical protein
MLLYPSVMCPAVHHVCVAAGSLVANAPHLPVHLGAMSEAVRFQVAYYGQGGAGQAEGLQVRSSGSSSSRVVGAVALFGSSTCESATQRHNRRRTLSYRAGRGVATAFLEHPFQTSR